MGQGHIHNDFNVPFTLTGALNSLYSIYLCVFAVYSKFRLPTGMLSF